VAGIPPVLYVKHGGLLDIAVDPGFSTNGLIYLSYLQGEESASTMRVLKARFDEQNEALADAQIIFESTILPNPELVGGRLALTGDGSLFLSIGDTWKGDPAQDLSDHRGSIIRIRTDGSVPEDNPFKQRVGARAEIWSYGHRNPQGLAFDRVTGQLWEHEHGPQGGDELNLIFPGRNYGWPLATYGIDYSGHLIANGTYPGTEQPVHYWVPLSIAPSSLAVKTEGSRTTLFIGALAGEMLVQLTVVGNCVVSEKHLLKHQLGRIRDVRIDQSGTVYVLAENGTLYRLERWLDGVGPDKGRL
jgi:glucose/arabinose dehydrogenase